MIPCNTVGSGGAGCPETMVVCQADVGEYRFAGGWLGQGGVPTPIRVESVGPIGRCGQVVEARRRSLLVGECVPKNDLLCLNYCKWNNAPRVE